MANQQPPLPLEDIILSPTQGFWPLAPGWWALIALTLIVISWGLFQLIKKRRAMAFFRQQQKQLDLIEKQIRNNALTSQQVLTTLNRLLKLLLVNYSKRPSVGKLTGQHLVNWLEKQLTIPKKLSSLFDDSVFQNELSQNKSDSNKQSLVLLSSYRIYQKNLVLHLLSVKGETEC